MKKVKSPIYLRYEFSDEAGKPEGGDIFEFTHFKEVGEMISEILEVAHGDEVALNLTIGEKGPFFGFLTASGMSKKDIEKEMVDLDLAPISTQATKKTKKATKKVAKKATKKASKKRK